MGSSLVDLDDVLVGGKHAREERAPDEDALVRVRVRVMVRVRVRDRLRLRVRVKGKGWYLPDVQRSEVPRSRLGVSHRALVGLGLGLGVGKDWG